MIDREGQLETVRRKPVVRRKQAGIVDEHIEPVVPGQDLVGQPAHVAEPRKIGERDLDPIRPGTLGHQPTRRLGPPAVAARHDDPHSDAGKANRSVQPDAGTRPGDDRDLLRLTSQP